MIEALCCCVCGSSLVCWCRGWFDGGAGVRLTKHENLRNFPHTHTHTSTTATMAMLAAVVRHSARVAAATRVTTTPAVGCVARATCQRVCASQTVGKTQQQHHALQPSSPFVLTPSHVCLCCCPVWLQCAAAKHKRRSGYNSTASYWWRQGMQLWLHVLGVFWATQTATLTILLGP